MLVWVGSILRLWRLSAAELWYDEINTAWVGHQALPQVIQASQGDVHPPLWYLIEWVIIHLHYSAFAMRLPSVVLSIAALILLIHLARKIGLSEGATLIGLAIMVFSPFELYFAQEARMYALLQFEIMLGIWAVLDRRWWLLTLCAALMMYTHNYGIVYAAMLYVFAFVLEVWKYRGSFQRQLLEWFFSGLIALILYAPWVPSLLAQFQSMGTWWQQPTTFGAFILPLNTFLWGGVLPTFISSITSYTLLIFSLVRAVQFRSKVALGLAAFCLAPMLFSWATELVAHPTYLYRTFIGSAPALYLLFGWTLTERVDILKRRIAVATLAPMFVIATILFYPTNELTKMDANHMDEKITLQPGDIVYHMNVGSSSLYWYRYTDRPEMWTYVSPHIEGDIGTLSSKTVTALGMKEANLDDLQWRRAWLVYSTGPTMGVMEDELVRKLIADHQGVQVAGFALNYSILYSGGLWLLKR